MCDYAVRIITDYIIKEQVVSTNSKQGASS